MGGNKQLPDRKKYLAIAGVAILLCALVASLAFLAQKPETALAKALASALGWGDDGTLEVGVEWINDFPGEADDRSHWDESCDGLYYDLLSEGWTGRFHFTDWSAWEKDWKRSALGGWEDSYADNVDIAMLCTHGSRAWDSCWSKNLSSVYFGSTTADHDLSPCDAYHAYGDKDAEWIAFDSCSVLSDDSKAYWAASMNGLHLLLGFKNTMYVISYGDGKRWAEYMQGNRFCFLGICWWLRPPYKVAQAWFETIDDLQPGGVCGRVLAEESYFYNDYLWGKGSVSSDYVDNDYYWLDHCSCTPPPERLAPETLEQIETLPVIEVVDRQVNQQYVQNIALAFPELTGGEIYSDTNYYFMINAMQAMTYTLQVDRVTGGFKFRNQSEVWSSPVDPPVLPLEGEALALSEEFFAAVRLPAEQYRTGDSLFMLEEQVEVSKLDPLGNSPQQEELSRVPVQAALSFGRVIPIQYETRAGTFQATELSVVGPGGRMKLYFGDGGDILGLQGGSRDIHFTGDQVTIMDAQKAWDLYLEDPSIALAQIPWEAELVEKTGETLGYYEQPYQQSQSQMIPTWVFSATFSTPPEIFAENVLVYVPASADFLPPDISIISPAPDTIFNPGEPVTFTGEVVANGTAPFTYNWYSSNDGYLGSGSTLEAYLSSAFGKDELVNHMISLEVIDANGQMRTATVPVFVKAAIYLPEIIQK